MIKTFQIYSGFTLPDGIFDELRAEGFVELLGDGLGRHPLAEGLEYARAKLTELLAFESNIAYVRTPRINTIIIRVLDSQARRTHPHIVTKADKVWYSRDDIDFSEVEND